MISKDPQFRYQHTGYTDSNTSGELNLAVRKAQTIDLPNLKLLYRYSIGALCKADYSQEQMAQWMLSANDARRWKRAVRNQYFLVAEVEQTMAGFISLDQGDYVDFLFVHPGFHGLGVGSMLYKLVEDKSKSLRKPKIVADVSITAKSFFQHQGFRVIKKNKHRRNGVVLINFKMIKHL